jgi:GT2 family glycosyltransferase
MTDSNEFITVIIPTYNRKDTLKKCLDAFPVQTYPKELYEIIVIDDGSTDGTEKYLREASQQISNLRYFSQNQGGPAKARNLGIKNAKGPLILFTGDDCIAAPRLLEEHNKSHRKEKNIAVLGHIDWHPDLEITPFMEYIGNTIQFCYPQIEKESSSLPYYFFYTSNISFDKKVFSHSGYFDEDFKTAAYEDIELGYRIWKAGIRVIYNKKALTYHYHQMSLEDFLKRQVRSGAAAGVLFAKHPELEDVIHIEDLTDPRTREEFYSSACRYYYAAGIQSSLDFIKNEFINKMDLPITLEDILKRWNLKVSDRLLSMLKIEKFRRIHSLEKTIRKLQEEYNEMHQAIEKLKARNSFLEKEFKEHEEFARKVKASMPYRIYKSIKLIIGRTTI